MKSLEGAVNKEENTFGKKIAPIGSLPLASLVAYDEIT